MFEFERIALELPSERTMWLGRELNPRHEDFQSSALPTELPSRSGKSENRMSKVEANFGRRVVTMADSLSWARVDQQTAAASTAMRPRASNVGRKRAVTSRDGRKT